MDGVALDGLVGRMQKLQWDSLFFGVGTARIELAGATAADLLAAEQEALTLGVRCIYAELDPAEADLIELVQRFGFRVVEVAMHLDHPTSILVDPPPTTATVRVASPEDLPALEAQVAAVAPWSRFAVDPRFGLAVATAMHRAWIERAARGEDGRMLLVAEDGGAITSMAAVQLAPPGAGRSRIDLIATTAPRSGAAQALVSHAFSLFAPGPSDGGPIAARNVVSLRFSEQMGYRVAGVRYLLHRWLDDEVRVGPARVGP